MAANTDVRHPGSVRGTVILVEGPSDRAAVEVLARRLYGTPDGVEVKSMGGVTNIGRALTDVIDAGQFPAGLVDADEVEYVVNAMQNAGHGAIDASDLPRLGFFVCKPDLEGELIRGVGVEEILEIIANQRDDARRFRSMQNQPQWRNRPIADQLARWFGSGGNRKIRYARLLAESVKLERIPEPIAGVLGFALDRN